MKAFKIPIILCISIFILTLAPKSNANKKYSSEPSFEIYFSTKVVSDSSLEAALSQHSLSQISHGLLIISILGMLAFKRR